MNKSKEWYALLDRLNQRYSARQKRIDAKISKLMARRQRVLDERNEAQYELTGKFWNHRARR